MSDAKNMDDIFMLLFHFVDQCHDLSIAGTGEKNVRLIESLTHRQAKALFIIGFCVAPEADGLHLKELAARLGMTCATASVLVDTMVKKNLFVRTRSEEDRRAICIRLSDAGKKTLQIIKKNNLELTRHLLDSIPPADQAAFARVIRHLFRRVTELPK